MSRYPGAVWLPVTGHDGGPMAHPPLGLVLHVAEGNGSLRGYFQRSVHPNRKSATWWCGKDGRLEQYLDSTVEPWSQGDGNATYASVETEGYATEPLTDAQIVTLAHLYAWGAQVHGWPFEAVDTPGQRGLILHSDGGAAWGGHSCPGPIRAAQRADILDLTPAPQPTPPVEDDDMIVIWSPPKGTGGAAIVTGLGLPFKIGASADEQNLVAQAKAVVLTASPGTWGELQKTVAAATAVK